MEHENAGAAICEAKRMNRQANQERIREMIRFVLNTIKWLTPNKEERHHNIMYVTDKASNWKAVVAMSRN